MSSGVAELLSLQDQMAERGFVVIKQGLGEVSLTGLCEVTDAIISHEPDSNPSTGVSFGTDNKGNLRYDRPLYMEPAVVDMLTESKMLEVLGKIRSSKPVLLNLLPVLKRPGAKAMTWHHDFYRDDNGDELTEAFILCYTQHVRADNGGLRVVPGSHQWSASRRNLASGHSKPMPGGEVVDMNAGDMFVGDRRLLHGTYPNMTTEWRAGFSIATTLDFDLLPPDMQKSIASNSSLPPINWRQTELANQLDPRLQAILPEYPNEVKETELV